MSRLNIAATVKSFAYREVTAGHELRLSSGLFSREYLDIKSMILADDGGQHLAHFVTQAMGAGSCDVVAGVETGGAILARLVGGVRLKSTLCVRKEERNHGTTLYGIDGLSNLPPAQYGDNRDQLNTWLVEDVITTGVSTLKALEKLQKFGRLRLAGVICVVDREEGGLARVKDAVPAGTPVLALTTLSEVRQAEL